LKWVQKVNSLLLSLGAVKIDFPERGGSHNP
jgi:hypothetical protein